VSSRLCGGVSGGTSRAEQQRYVYREPHVG
jgi:hypothetical protein